MELLLWNITPGVSMGHHSLHSQQQEFKKVTFSELNKLTILRMHNLWISDDQQQSEISIVISKEIKLCDESQNRLESD